MVPTFTSCPGFFPTSGSLHLCHHPHNFQNFVGWQFTWSGRSPFKRMLSRYCSIFSFLSATTRAQCQEVGYSCMFSGNSTVFHSNTFTYINIVKTSCVNHPISTYQVGDCPGLRLPSWCTEKQRRGIPLQRCCKSGCSSRAPPSCGPLTRAATPTLSKYWLSGQHRLVSQLKLSRLRCKKKLWTLLSPHRLGGPPLVACPRHVVSRQSHLIGAIRYILPLHK